MRILSSPRLARHFPLPALSTFGGALLTLLSCLAVSTPGRAESVAERVRIYQLALLQQIAEPARPVYLGIEGDGRRLLAARSYLRAGDSLHQRWSWSSDEIQRFRQSQEARELEQEIAKVKAEFERRNPGYSLYVNTEVRSTDLQLRRWNSNPTVAKVAAQLHREAERHLSSGAYPHVPDDDALARFSRFLSSWYPSTQSPLAAPGLSAHGRARAVDFAVVSGKQLVAPTEIAKVRTVWDAQGWTEKLQAAVQAASTRFQGPLEAPREPWHYEYRPRGCCT